MAVFNSGSIMASFQNPTHVSATDALLIAVIGVSIVFAVLILLMVIIWAFGAVLQKFPELAAKHPAFSKKIASMKTKISSFGKKKAEEGRESEAERDSVPDAERAAGTCGELKLVKTGERDAALIMAIVADALDTPLNELRFISIRNISEGEQK